MLRSGFLGLTPPSYELAPRKGLGVPVTPYLTPKNYNDPKYG